MKGFIYTITNTTNNEYYLGSTVDVNVRFNKHMSDLDGQRHHNKHLQSSFNKHGKDKFVFSIMYESTDIKRDEQAELDKLDYTMCYNISRTATGGDVTHNHPDVIAIRRKQSQARLGCKPSNSMKVSIEGVEYESITEAAKMLEMPMVTVNYRCVRSKNRLYSDWFVIGKEKTGLVSRGTSNGHKVVCYGTEYSSMAEAARDYALSVSAMENRIKSDNFPDFIKVNA